MTRLPRPTDAPLVWATFYIDAFQWGLSQFEPGTKGPSGERAKDWNKPERWIDTPAKARAAWRAHPTDNIGLIHEASGTVAIDVDHVEHTRTIFAAFGLDLDVLFADAPRIRGKIEGRDKVIFRAPEGDPLPMHKAWWKHPTDHARNVTLFELRAGRVHDVLPPSLHPDGHRYAWRVAPWELDAIPTIPAPLLAFWRAFPTYRARIAAMAPWAEDAPPPPPSPPPAPRRWGGGERHDHGDVIGAFNKAHDIAAILTAHGYVRQGRRFLAPSSSTGIPGIVVLDDGKVYSHHGSDPLADGHAHDAFSLYCLLDHGGDVRAAVRAAADALGIKRDITRRSGVRPLSGARPIRDVPRIRPLTRGAA